MIWATVSSQSCLCWLYRASPHSCLYIASLLLSCKEYNQSDFSVVYLVMSMCRISSCVVGRGERWQIINKAIIFVCNFQYRTVWQKVILLGISLVGQWLRIHLPTRDLGSIAGWGTKIPLATVHLSLYITTREPEHCNKRPTWCY